MVLADSNNDRLPVRPASKDSVSARIYQAVAKRPSPHPRPALLSSSACACSRGLACTHLLVAAAAAAAAAAAVLTVSALMARCINRWILECWRGLPVTHSEYL
jgi:hypothetical protein